MIRNKKEMDWKRYFYQKSGIYLMSVIILFIFIGVLTTISPAYRFSSQTISEWTSKIESSTFLYLLGLENRAFQQAYPKDEALPQLSTTIFQLATSVKPNDPRSLLGHELPGFSAFDTKIVIAGEGTDYTNLPFESAPPLEEILKDRQAKMDEPPEEKQVKKDTPSTGKRDVVYIYSSHSRESFLPQLPEVTDPDQAYHSKVNITMVGDRFNKALQANGIGASVEKTDIMKVLNDKGWDFAQSYKASREVVQEAFSSNKDIQYLFDLHRDASPRKKTTITINGKDYAKIMFVVGAENPNYEKNLAFASKLQDLIDEKQPGLSRGVITKKGAGTNGIFNQDLSENSLLIEFGGVYNNLEELYRTADILADIFSEFYWDAEKVDADS